MSEQYIIQQFVRRVFDRMPDLPYENYEWSKDFLGDLTNHDFYTGICAFSNLITDILDDVIADPQSWGIPCYETQEIFCAAPITPEESKSMKGFFRIGKMLYALATCGNLMNQSLYIDNEAFQKYKITKGNLILDKLQDFGFVIDDYNKKSLEFIIEYPDNYAVLQVIKAYTFISDVKYDEILERMMRAEWHFFSKDKGNDFQFNLEDFCKGLATSDAELAKLVHDLVVENGYATNFRICDLKFEPKHKKDKKRLLYMKRERDNLFCDFRFDDVYKYADELDYVTDEIRDAIIQWFKESGCIKCGRPKCPGPVTLRYNGGEYEKCMMSMGARFVSVSTENSESILRLLKCEIQSRHYMND